MVDVLTEITINRPRDQVAEYAANPDNAPEWYVNINSAEWQTPKRIEVGSKVAFKAAFLGRELSYVYQIAEYTPGKKLVMRTADGPFPMETTYTWESLSGHSTRMTLRNKGNPSGFSILFTPFMSLMMKRANKKDLNKIKFLLEETAN
ncbi:SRPBCC family protein [Paenibacillus harenae]|uniref:SRPBCC family protein n=1 Tax=Paenibacillus harenae TaxID=306543 RepID=UPI0027935C09|nr:SRPBCC family protein [Paenibacillus harenae]MDQ0062162.1 putative membrane protein [Paenibacillus harenae]